MRFLCVITAISLAAVSLPAEAKRATAAGATKAAITSNADDAMRVAIVPPIVEGELAASDRDALVGAVERGLGSDSYELLSTPAGARIDDKPCKTQVCRQALAQKLDATHLVELHVKAASREYEVELRAYGADDSEPFATAAGACNICGLAELEQMVASKADALRQRLTNRELAPALVAVSSVPSGGTVRIDGVDVGVTPYSGEVQPGPHTIEVVRDGFFAETVPVPHDGICTVLVRCTAEHDVVVPLARGRGARSHFYDAAPRKLALDASKPGGSATVKILTEGLEAALQRLHR